MNTKSTFMLAVLALLVIAAGVTTSKVGIQSHTIEKRRLVS